MFNVMHFFRPNVSARKRKEPQPSVFKPLFESLLASLKSIGLVKTLLFVLAVLFLSSIYNNPQQWLEKLDSSPIKAYALSGQFRFTTNADIREALTQEPELKGFFVQDIREVAQKIRAIPWVKDVVVRKIYPDRLSITLVEHQPVAIWNNHQFLSSQGDVFGLPAERFNSVGLPLLYGPDSQSKLALEAWHKIGQDLQQRNLILKSLEVDERGAWKITLNGNIELRLGRGDWLPKIDRFVAVYPNIEIPEGKALSYVDLRYEHGVVVGFRAN